MKATKYSFLFIAVFLIIFLLWGVFGAPYQVDYQEERGKIPNLPSAWKNQQIAMVADFQVGMWLSNKGAIENIAVELSQRKPKAILIAGDFIYHPIGDESREEIREEDEEIEEVLSELRQVLSLLSPLIDLNIPIYAVLGNHDYAMEKPHANKLAWVADQVQTTLEDAGITVLVNESVALKSPEELEDDPLYLVGIGSHYANNDDPQRALAQLPDDAARIVFMHNPDSFASFPAGTAPLALAGHTHGGQIRLPWASEWSWMSMLDDNEVHADGWIEGYGNRGNKLYVNRGIGFSMIPVRLNAAPEVTLLTLD